MWWHRRTKTIFVVGNGFDMYHGIPSSYLKFRDYVEEHEIYVYNTLQKYLHLNSDDEWNAFESNLVNLDSDDLLEEMRIYLGDPGGEWRDSMNHDYQYGVNQVTDKLGTEMQKLFLQWVLQLPISHTFPTPRLVLPANGLYLNFNYTNSLEKLYNIPPKNILYIHGKAVDAGSAIVLGHGWSDHIKATAPRPITYEDFIDGDYSTEEDWQHTEAKEYIKDYFRDSFKDTPFILKRHKRFFRKFKSAEHIYVMGHSMSEVDRLYFKAIANRIDKDRVKWTVSYYRAADIPRCRETLQAIGIDMSLVEFKRLEDFFSGQLKLF